ncbi:MAG: hypothetical protein ABIH88_03505 [Patescibacteria group bacterium]|nr:hypothetical protein [Patescibacteria group bacterium]
MAVSYEFTLPKYDDFNASWHEKLNIAGFKFSDGDIGTIISGLIPYVFAISGIVLFIFLIIGGFGLLTSGGNPDSVKSAQGKITSALIGFLIIFGSFWIIRLLEIFFGIKVF